MDKKYENIYNQFEKNFKEEAEGFIPEEDIKSTLQMEQVLFNNAYKYNIPVNKFAGSSLARYTKDTLRQRQPLFFIYYVLSQVTSFFYCLLIWGTIKCTFLYSCKGNIKKKISVFNISCYLISACIVIASAMLLYLNKENYLSVYLSLFQIFIIAAAFLSASGIHNVIYSSNCASFVAICCAIVQHKVPETEKAVSAYIQASLKTFLVKQKISGSSYNDNNQISAEYKIWLRSHVVTLRAYSAIAFFIAFMLAVICLRQLFITGVSAGMAIFGITVLLVTVMLFLGILSCNQILKAGRDI